MQQGAVRFEDVAVRFSPEEWVQLSGWQRRLYWDVMTDNYRLVASLAARGEDVSEDAGHGLRVQRAAPPAEEDKEDCPPLWCPVDPHELPAWEQAGVGSLLICGTCGQSFEDEAGLSAHRHEHPPSSSSSSSSSSSLSSSSPSYPCGVCGKVFRHRLNLLTHKKHRGRRRHVCAECGRAFCLRGDLLRHRASHGAEGGYPCPLCGHRFRHKRGLEAHGKEHAARPVERSEEEEEKPFLCGRCDRRFSWRESLLIHRRSHHAPERSHTCADCGRTFSRRANLRAHRRVHTGERPFACALCDRTFCNKANLVTHQRLHRRRRTFACPRCHRSFCSRSKLRRHQRAHGDGGNIGSDADACQQ